MLAERFGEASSERQRVQRHIWSAEQLAKQNAGPIDPVARINRLLLLDELRRYRKQGSFPINRDWRRRVPQFIDSTGTRCAVAHLMDVSGVRELAQRVASTNNLARVQELARISEFRAWLKAAGLTLEEAARIQPSYGPEPCVNRQDVSRHGEEVIKQAGLCVRGAADACFCGPRNGDIAIGTVVGTGELPDGASDTGVFHETARVRVDRIESGFATLNVGAEVLAPMDRSAEVGERLLLAGRNTKNVVDLDYNLTVDDAGVHCDFAPEVVPLKTAVIALKAPRDQCISILAETGKSWGWRGEDTSDGACAYAPRSNAQGAELTSLAIFATLVLRRVRRRMR